jgi:hypothetical protein
MALRRRGSTRPACAESPPSLKRDGERAMSVACSGVGGFCLWCTSAFESTSDGNAPQTRFCVAPECLDPIAERKSPSQAFVRAVVRVMSRSYSHRMSRRFAKPGVHRPSCISRVVQGSADPCSSPIGEVNLGTLKRVSEKRLGIFTRRVVQSDACLAGVWQAFGCQSDSGFGAEKPRAGQHIMLLG